MLKFRPIIISIVAFILFQGNVYSQQQEKLIKYDPEFKFHEGIYLNFNQVKNNDPIIKARIISKADYNSDDFFDEILNNKTIVYFNELGTRAEVAKEKIWGFCRNGLLYINVNGGFNRINIVGSISHFIATITTYNTRYNDPYFYSPYSNPYNSPYGYGRPRSYETSEMRQFIMSFATGQVLDYDVNGLKILLMTDPELHDEYSNLKKKKQKQLKFLYIRKFNERNPLYLPK